MSKSHDLLTIIVFSGRGRVFLNTIYFRVIKNKVTLNQSNELAFVSHAHSPSDQGMYFLTSGFHKVWEIIGG